MSTLPFNPFRAALPHLRTSTDLDRGPHAEVTTPVEFICWAITNATKRKDEPVRWSTMDERRNQDLSRRARNHVQRLIGEGGGSVVEQWLEKHVPAYRALPTDTFEERRLRWAILQAYRWRWLTHLADQYDLGLMRL